MEMKCYPDVGALARGAAQFVVDWAREAVSLKGSFTFVLSGGNTPKPLYKTLSSIDYRKVMPWEQTHVFWGDERCVPKDHADSNYGMAYETMLKHLELPNGHVHRLPGETEPPEGGADAYERELKHFFASGHHGEPSPTSRSTERGFASFDLVLLGLGKDGHTASLFQGDAALEEETRWAVAVRNPRARPRVPRITLTLPLINEARCVMFLVSGEDKSQVIQAVLDDAGNPETAFPAARVRPKGRLLWYRS